MNDLQAYIDAGWFTVPLNGKIVRQSDGKKTIPKFPENWKDNFRENFNKKPTELGGVLTGSKSNIIAIDCDSDAAYKIFKSLDPDYDAVMHSVGKLDKLGNEITAATIIYEYVPELDDSFSLPYGNDLALDFYSSSGFIYLPTKANESKVAWETLPKIKEPPSTVIALLQSLRPKKVKEQILATQNKRFNLNPQITKLIKDKQVDKALFKILTPKDFRELSYYVNTGYLNPKDVPDGRGSEYLSKVSAILGADHSVDEALYEKAMDVINNLFEQPMKSSQLAKTIVEPMIECRASIDDIPIWQYDEHWQDKLVNVTTKLNTVLNLFYDMDRRLYYAINAIEEKTHLFHRDTELFSFIDTVATDAPGRKELKTALPLVSVTSEPLHDFGFYGHNEFFNIFRSTVPLAIFKRPENYKSSYRRPIHLLAFMQSLVPDDYMRNYLFRFLNRKFATFEYSPVILYFLGVSGSGKDLFVSILELIIGTGNVGKPSAKEFVEKHNGWMLDKYFAHLDEYGDQLTRQEMKEEAKGIIKALTGKRNVQVRTMCKDGFDYLHNITMIMTANSNPIAFDSDDRRVALFSTPNVLRFNKLAQELGLETFVNRVLEEVNDFAYWLATECDMATVDEYQTPPETADKQKLIASKLSAGASIYFHLNNKLFDELNDIALSLGINDLLDYAADNRIMESSLFSLYDELTDGKGTKRGLTIALKGFVKTPTTNNGIKAYYYTIPGLYSATETMDAIHDPEDDSTITLETL